MTASTPVVSVVMIFKNASAFMDEAIRSVMDQTHRGVELLLCDDGSTDASTELAKGWAQRNPPTVRYIEHEGHAHRGTGASRNLGIAAARGEFVAFLDADDVWLPEHLAGMVRLLQLHPQAGMVCGRALDWRSWSGSDEEEIWSPLPRPPGTVVPPPAMLTAVLRNGAYSTPVCSLLIRRQALLDQGGSDDAFTSMFEDQVLLARMYLTQSVVISGARTALYRQHDGSSTAAAISRGDYARGAPSPTREAFLRWLQAQPQVSGADSSPELSSALDAALAPYELSPADLRLRGRRVARAVVPPRARRWIKRALQHTPPPGRVRMGSLRRVAPLSSEFGFDRGRPIDRFYIEAFLAENADLIAGRVLEVGDAAYTHRFGAHRVTRSDVLNVAPGDPATTFIGDLADASEVPSAAFDCVVLTQTLHLIYDMPAAVRTLHRILRPGGVLLLTAPGISQISTDQWAKTWYWSLSPLAADRLVSDVFGAEQVEVTSYGNVLSSIAFLHGLAADELRPAELAVRDGAYPLLVSVRAVRGR